MDWSIEKVANFEVVCLEKATIASVLTRHNLMKSNAPNDVMKTLNERGWAPLKAQPKYGLNDIVCKHNATCRWLLNWAMPMAGVTKLTASNLESTYTRILVACECRDAKAPSSFSLNTLRKYIGIRCNWQQLSDAKFRNYHFQALMDKATKKLASEKPTFKAE